MASSRNAKQAKADNASWWEALGPYLHHTADCLLQPCTCGLDALASGLGLPQADVDANVARLAIEAVLWERESLPAEWITAQLLARLSLPGARLEAERVRDYLEGMGCSLDFIHLIADRLREQAVRAGANPEHPGRDAIDRVIEKGPTGKRARAPRAGA